MGSIEDGTAEESTAADAFVSYSRWNGAIANDLVHGAARRSRVFWLDARGIAPGSEWRQELRQALESALAMICVVSPTWLASPECRQEYESALRLGKRLIPVLAEPVRHQDLPPNLQSVQWIETAGRDIDHVVTDILSAIDVDIQQVREHTMWLDRSLRWEVSGRESSLLVRGRYLRQAEAWLARGAIDPAPTPLQTAFVSASRQVERRRQRRTTVFVSAALVVAVVLGLVAAYEWKSAIRQRNTAIARELVAASQSPADQLDPRKRRLQTLAAWSIDRSPETYGAMLQAAASPMSEVLLGTIAPLAVNRTGTLLVGADNVFGHVILADAHTLSGVGSYFTTADQSQYVATSIAITSDSTLIAVGDREGSVRVWDAKTQKQVGPTLTGSTSTITSVTFSPDGRLLVAGSLDGTVRTWDVASRRRLYVSRSASPGGVWSVDISPDGHTLAIGRPHEVALETLSTGAVVTRLPAFGGGSLAGPLVRFSPDGRTLAVTGPTVRLWNVATHQSAELANTLGLQVDAVAFSPDGETLATANNSNASITLWGTTAGQQLGPPLTGQQGTISSLSFGASSDTLYSASDRSVVVWNTTIDRPAGKTMKDENVAVRSLAVSPDGRSVAVAGADGSLVMWDSGTRTERWRIPSVPGRATSGLWSVAFSPDGTEVATAGGDNLIRVWDAQTGRIVGSPLLGNKGIAYSVAFSPDGKLIAGGGGDDTLRWWDAHTHNLLGSVPPDAFTERDPIVSVVFDADGSLISTTPDGAVQQWDIHRQKTIRSFPGIATSVVAVSRDGHTVATSDGHDVLLFGSHEDDGELDGIKRSVSSVAISADNEVVATATIDGVSLWGRGDQQLLADPLVLGDVDSIAFDSSGHFLVTGAADGSVTFWDLSRLTNVSQTLCSMQLTPFTAEERAALPSGPSYGVLCK